MRTVIVIVVTITAVWSAPTAAVAVAMKLPAEAAPLGCAPFAMKILYRLINFQQGLNIGDYPTLQEAWEVVKVSKGRMILWEMKETPVGWIWKQQPLKFYSWKERVAFRFKGTLTKVRAIPQSWSRLWTKAHRAFRSKTKAG